MIVVGWFIKFIKIFVFFYRITFLQWKFNIWKWFLNMNFIKNIVYKKWFTHFGGVNRSFFCFFRFNSNKYVYNWFATFCLGFFFIKIVYFMLDHFKWLFDRFYEKIYIVKQYNVLSIPNYVACVTKCAIFKFSCNSIRKFAFIESL